jgi:GTPase SAR1 family protein
MREPTLEELEKLEEEKLISRLENMNKSFKNKNKKDFISAVTELYTSTSGVILANNDNVTSSNPSLSTLASKGALMSLKNKRSHSFDTIEGVEFDFNYDNSKSNNNRKKKALEKETEKEIGKEIGKDIEKEIEKDIEKDTSAFLSNVTESSTSLNFPESTEANPSNKFTSNNSLASSNSTNFTLSSVSSLSSSNALRTDISTSQSTIRPNMSSDNIENIIMQNLSIHDETIKLMVIGDKAVGKTLFIDNLCTGNNNINNKEDIISNNSSNNSSNNNNSYNNLLNVNKDKNKNNSHTPIPSVTYPYKPTQTLEIKRFIFSTLNKLIKIELWDTNINILNSPIIKTYFKLCHGFILTCDISNLESIKFLEKQIENIINFSTFSNDNLILYANIKDEVNTENYFENFNYLNSMIEKFNSNANANANPNSSSRNNLINFVNFREINIKIDLKFQRFINSCLIKKVGKGRNSRTGSKKILQNSITGNNLDEISKGKSLSFIDKENTSKDGDIFSSTSKEELRDLSASPRTKKEKCVIF